MSNCTLFGIVGKWYSTMSFPSAIKLHNQLSAAPVEKGTAVATMLDLRLEKLAKSLPTPKAKTEGHAAARLYQLFSASEKQPKYQRKLRSIPATA